MKVEKRLINHEGWKRFNNHEGWKQRSSTLKVGKRFVNPKGWKQRIINPKGRTNIQQPRRLRKDKTTMKVQKEDYKS